MTGLIATEAPGRVAGELNFGFWLFLVLANIDISAPGQDAFDPQVSADTNGDAAATLGPVDEPQRGS